MYKGKNFLKINSTYINLEKVLFINIHKSNICELAVEGVKGRYILWAGKNDFDQKIKTPNMPDYDYSNCLFHKLPKKDLKELAKELETYLELKTFLWVASTEIYLNNK